MNKKTKIVKKKHRKARLRMKAKQRELLKNKVSTRFFSKKDIKNSFMIYYLIYIIYNISNTWNFWISFKLVGT